MKKSISGFCGALGFFLTSAAFAGGLSEGLLLHYPFDRDEGPVLTDASGSGRFGWAHGATWVVDGANGGGCRFDSNRQYVVADDAGLPRGDAPRTMALWIKLDKLAPDPVTALLTYGRGSWNHMSGIGMDWRVGRANFYFTQCGGVALSEWRMEKPGVWHHLAYVYEGKGQHRFYVDGRPGNGMSELWGPLDTQLSGAVIVGADPTGTGPAGGVLDDVRIYGRALSEKEIAELAQGDQPSGDADSDGDGYSDALEIARGSDPLDPESVPKAATFYVDASRPDDAGDAASWATAKQTLQAGVDLAVLAGDVVLVNDGVYETGNRATPGCQLQNRVLITNEITVRSVNGPEATMIRGQGPRGTNAVRCAYMTAGNLIGFTLANGHTRMDGDGNGDQNGGGLSVSVSNRVVVSNCVFRGNSAYNAGGAIFGTFYNCVMEGNSAARAGGAACCATLYNCELSGNSATYYGGAADQCRFYNCTITGNSAASGGGVFHCMLYNSIAVSNRPANAEWATCLYSCVDPLQAGEGNIAADPRLLSGGHLASDSPCVGAGSAAYAFGTDLDGEAWRNPPSIGCDEVPALADLLVHYTFDQDEGDIVTDASGNGRTAKVNGATWVKDGARGGAVRFDGNSETITATDAGLPSGDAPRSIALWMKIDREYEEGCTGMLGYGTDNYNRQFSGLGFDWRLDRDRVYFSPGGACFLTERKLPKPGTWIHVAYTYGGNGDHHLYVDGAPSDGMNELWGPVGTLLSGQLRMGGHPGNPGPDGGYLDDVRIYGRVLSEKEIAELAVGSAGESEPGEGSGNSETNRNDGIEVRTIGSGTGVAGALTVQWACEPGAAYDLYWTDDLTRGFTRIASELVADGAAMTYTNALAGTRIGFYRVALHE